MNYFQTEDQLETTLNQMIIKNRDCEELADRERKLREESEFVIMICPNLINNFIL